MTSVLPDKKPVDSVSRDVVNRLDNYHRTLAEVLAERGVIRIVDGVQA